MDKETLRLVIVDQRKSLEEKLRDKNIIVRDASKSIVLKAPTAFIVLGVRRSGKSTLSEQLFIDDKFGYINFDDERLLGTTRDDLNIILQIFYELYGSDLGNIILDEIQLVPGWEPFVSRLRDTKKVIVTGSSSKLLSGELSTRLTGRHIDLLLFPFSFNEFLTYKHWNIPKAFSTTDRAEVVRLLDEYISSGGFPEQLTLGRQIIRNIYNDIITKDIVIRHKIKYIDDLRQAARFLVSNSSKEFTYSSLKGVTGAKSIITLSNWVRYLEEAYLIFKIERFSYKLKQTILAPKKIYCVDVGIINGIGPEPTGNKGRLMENTVAMELIKGSKNVGFEVFYWKDHQGREVDFIIKDDRKVAKLIQATYATSREAIEDREIKSLVIASNELRCNNLFIVTWDYEGSIVIEGKKIALVPLWKWLLNKEL
jgi:hypothetical protein